MVSVKVKQHSAMHLDHDGCTCSPAQATTRGEELGGWGVRKGAEEEREMVLIRYQIYRDQRRPVVAMLFQPHLQCCPIKCQSPCFHTAG